VLQCSRRGVTVTVCDMNSGVELTYSVVTVELQWCYMCITVLLHVYYSSLVVE
jgi:hypothetical protein